MRLEQKTKLTEKEQRLYNELKQMRDYIAEQLGQNIPVGEEYIQKYFQKRDELYAASKSEQNEY